ncbi:hypothetical protein GPECTOR_31g405 [Gonium pectorale]|uniref:Uncharacterized protein n=1 Tax=Gonium pectorale TaxID=33097 RepID=A0A150GDW2_GONPE|nr:hypothetical protein GPECTOR_31g405 [Gonium pectorale]|eukprot:KXZ48041.1 hypothetical protein GPECTOR_31g405 [Gonium pectorale]
MPAFLESVLPSVYGALFPPLPNATAPGCAAYPAAARSVQLLASDGPAQSSQPCFPAVPYNCSTAAGSFPPSSSCVLNTGGGSYFGLRSDIQIKNYTSMGVTRRMHCFGVLPSNVTPSSTSKCAGRTVSTLYFSANAALRSALSSFLVRAGRAERITVSNDQFWVRPQPAGNGPLSNVLRIPIANSWSQDLVRSLVAAGAEPPEVCLELRNGTSLRDFCILPGSTTAGGSVAGGGVAASSVTINGTAIIGGRANVTANSTSNATAPASRISCAVSIVTTQASPNDFCCSLAMFATLP